MLQRTTLAFSYDREMEKVLDNGGPFGALLIDLSKAFDCIPHELIIAKLEAYGFQIDTLRFVHDYLSNRKMVYRKDLFLVHVSSICICVIFFTSLGILILQAMRMIPP